MVSRYVNPSSYFLMNIDRITDNDRTQINRQMKKSTTLIRSSSQFYQNTSNNMFLNEMTTNRNYFQAGNTNNGNTRFRSSIETNRPTFRSNLSSTNLTTNGQSTDLNASTNQQLARPKCVVCSLL